MTPRKSKFSNRRIRQSALIVGISGLLGFVYALLWDSHDTLMFMINGVIIGSLCGLFVVIIEHSFRPLRRTLRFVFFFALKLLFYVVAFTISVFSVTLTSRSIVQQQGLIDTYRSDSYQHLLFKEDFHIMVLYALVLAAVIIFTREMSRKMGQGVLWNFIIGKYAKPFHEHRIFMFLDLEGSTSLAESLGDLRYHNLLNDFFYDITEAILEGHGSIYQYVGDEMVVSWKTAIGIKNANCIRTFLNVDRALDIRAQAYQQKYGCVPRFKAAMHCGKVISGEIGDVKSEIVFHGDVLNTTSRIERKAAELGQRLIISAELWNLIPLDWQRQFQSAGMHALKGKQQPLELFAWVGGSDENRLTSVGAE